MYYYYYLTIIIIIIIIVINMLVKLAWQSFLFLYCHQYQQASPLVACFSLKNKTWQHWVIRPNSMDQTQMCLA